MSENVKQVLELLAEADRLVALRNEHDRLAGDLQWQGFYAEADEHFDKADEILGLLEANNRALAVFAPILTADERRAIREARRAAQ
jgi:hypothetical protein